MVFKARDMPEFAKPFRPDHSKAALVTQSLDFSFRTDLRLGKAASPLGRMDNAAAQIDRKNGAGYGADPFMASLRSSVQSPRNNASDALHSPRNSLRSPMPTSAMLASPSSRLRTPPRGGADSPSGPSSPHLMM